MQNTKGPTPMGLVRLLMCIALMDEVSSLQNGIKIPVRTFRNVRLATLVTQLIGLSNVKVSTVGDDISLFIKYIQKSVSIELLKNSTMEGERSVVVIGKSINVFGEISRRRFPLFTLIVLLDRLNGNNKTNLKEGASIVIKDDSSNIAVLYEKLSVPQLFFVKKSRLVDASSCLETLVDEGVENLVGSAWFHSHRKRPPVSIAIGVFMPVIYWYEDPYGERTLRGVELEILEIALESITSNINRVFMTTSNIGFKEANGSFNGAAGEVQSNRAQICANVRYIQFTDTFDFSYPLQSEDYCAVVPKALQWPPAFGIILPFSKLVWLLLNLSLLSVSVVWAYISTNPNESAPNSMIRSIYQIYRVFITGGMSKCETNTKLRKIFVSIILIFSLIILNTFQGSLVSFYTKPKYFDDVETLEELDETFSHIFIYAAFISMFQYMPHDDIMHKLSNKFVETFDEWDDAMDRVCLRDGRAALLLHTIATFYRRRTRYTGRRPKLHVPQQCPLSPAYTAYLMQRGWPLGPRLSEVLLRLNAAGFWGKLSRSSDHTLALMGILADPSFSTTEHVPLSLDHLAAAFEILAAGCLIAFITFAYENSWFYYESRKKIYVETKENSAVP